MTSKTEIIRLILPKTSSLASATSATRSKHLGRLPIINRSLKNENQILKPDLLALQDDAVIRKCDGASNGGREEMSNFICDKCGTYINEGNGGHYITGCEHYPIENMNKDNINPSHYRSHPSGVECIEIIEHLPFNVGAAMKYLWRCGLKDNEIQELRKAEWFIKREIQRREKFQK